MQRYYITLGAPTTANGKVISATHVDTIEGALMALDGDTCWCPACNAAGIIELDGPRLSETFDGREVALSDDLCICKCNPPPRLVAAQTFAYQLIDAYWHAAATETAAATAAQLNTSGSAAPDTDDIPLVLLDPDTQEPFRHRPYRLECGDNIIQGTTDQDGATRPLTAAERASFIRWHVDDAEAPA
jgi:uncharacterized Zn-binding protein involved in type VI secretion